MAQLTLYIDDDTRTKIEAAANAAGSSVSAWVSARLRAAVAGEWPEHYFDLLGSLAKSDLRRPSEGSPAADVRRESF